MVVLIWISKLLSATCLAKWHSFIGDLSQDINSYVFGQLFEELDKFKNNSYTIKTTLINIENVSSSLFYSIWRNGYLRKSIRNNVLSISTIRITLEYLNDNHQFPSLLTDDNKQYREICKS